MTTLDLLSVIAILLSVVSATLSIAAFVFGWVTFRQTSKMQMDAQAILAKISEKVEVVVERTSHQLDKAWEYVTARSTTHTEKLTEETVKKETELKEHLKEEVRREAMEVIKEAGLDKKSVESLVARVESLIVRGVDRSRDLIDQQRLLAKIVEVEIALRDRGSGRMPAGLRIGELTNMMRGMLPSGAVRDLMGLAALRDRMLAGEELSSEEIRSFHKVADDLVAWLQAK